MMLYTVKLYRVNSEAVVVYENVKHVWWSAGNTILTISVFRDPLKPEHDYWEWPREQVDHIKIEKVISTVR